MTTVDVIVAVVLDKAVVAYFAFAVSVVVVVCIQNVLI